MKYLNSMIFAAFCLILMGCQAEMETDNDEKDHGEMDEVTELIDHGPDHHILYLPEDIPWEDGPGSLEEGSQFYILEGDPGKAEVFNMRLKLPDGFHIAPHTHPGVERVTVISGEFVLGHGAEADMEEYYELPPGSYTSMPPGMKHYAYARGETIVQLVSVGPWEIDYINPEDDPRLRDN